MTQDTTSLIGRPIEELTTDELATLSETIEARRKSLIEALEKEQFSSLAEAATTMAEALGWQKLPKITLTPDSAGKKYEVSLATATAAVRGPVRRATPDVNGGAITIRKIGAAKGGIAQFKSKTGKAYEGIKDLVKALKQPDGKPEADRCWDISKKGISASDIVIKYHASEVTLVYQNGDEQLVKDAVEELKLARAAA